MPAAQLQIHQHWSWLTLIYRALDAICLTGGLWLGVLGIYPAAELWLIAAATVIVFSFIAEMTGLYRNWRGAPTQVEIGTLLVTWLCAMCLLAGIALVVNYQLPITRAELFRWSTVSVGALCATRIVLRWGQYLLRAQGINTKSYAIVGVNELAFQLAKNIDQSWDLGLKLVGFFDDREEDRLPIIPAEIGQQCGDLDQLVELARQGSVQQIYLTFPMRAEERLNKVLARLSDTTANVYVVPDFFVFELLHSRWTQIGGLPAVSVFENPFYGVDGACKRAIDVVLGTLIAIILAIPMSLIALAIKFTSPGPVFFRQKRYGLDGKEIRVWKFRTMTVCEDGPVVTQATKNDSRVTPLGAFLRKTSLDELPQLINVLEGSMSLVGPRPHATAHNEQYRKLIPGYMLRHKVKPGITGLAQVNGWRGETDTPYKMEKRVEFDHKYIREWSPWLDLQILFQTIFTVFRRENAY